MLGGVLGRLRPGLPHGKAADVAVAAAVFALAAVSAVWSLVGAREEPWSVTAVSWVLLTLSCAALPLRRRHPIAVGSFVLVTTGVYYVLSAYDGLLLVAFVVALYTVAAEGHLRAAIVLASLTVLATGFGVRAGNNDFNSVALAMMAGWLVGTVALGWVRHSRLAYAREVEQRAASEERLRIARELHDVTGHHLSLVSVQSAAALRKLRRDPAGNAPQVEEALHAIKETSQEALRDLRATLGLLRQAGESAPTAPSAGLDRTGELVASARLAGLEVDTRISGVETPLPRDVDLAAYRIVQESLTNVTRHARAGTVHIRVSRGTDEVAIEVADDGRGPEPGGATFGSGIRGMRERARALGGELTAGQGPDGGFLVRARLPYRRNGASPP